MFLRHSLFFLPLSSFPCSFFPHRLMCLALTIRRWIDKYASLLFKKKLLLISPSLFDHFKLSPFFFFAGWRFTHLPSFFRMLCSHTVSKTRKFFQIFPKWCLPTKPCLAAEIIEEQTPDQEKLKLYDTTMILSWRFLCWTHIPFFFPLIMVYSLIVDKTYQNKILPK